LATNSSGSEKVVKLTEVVESMKAKMTASAEETKKAIAKADTAPATFSEMTKELVSLTRKVKQLEDRK
jgi:predicted FMN-binding regulatory protein PaiB